MDVGLNPTFFPSVLGVGLSTLDDKDEINRNEYEKMREDADEGEDEDGDDGEMDTTITMK